MADAPPVLQTDFTMEEEGEGKPAVEPVEPQTVEIPTALQIDDAIPRTDSIPTQDSTSPNLAQSLADNPPPLAASNPATEPLQPRSVTSRNTVAPPRSDAVFKIFALLTVYY